MVLSIINKYASMPFSVKFKFGNLRFPGKMLGLAGDVFANGLTQLILSDKLPTINNPEKINENKG